MRTFTRTPTFTGADGPARGEVRGRRDSNPVPMLSTKTQKRSRTPRSQGSDLPPGMCPISRGAGQSQNEKTQPPVLQEVALIEIGSGARTRKRDNEIPAAADQGKNPAKSLLSSVLRTSLENSGDGGAADQGQSKGAFGADDNAHSMHPPGLQLLIDAWPMLPDETRQRLVAVLREFEQRRQRNSA